MKPSATSVFRVTLYRLSICRLAPPVSGPVTCGALLKLALTSNGLTVPSSGHYSTASAQSRSWPARTCSASEAPSNFISDLRASRSPYLPQQVNCVRGACPPKHLKDLAITASLRSVTFGALLDSRRASGITITERLSLA